MSDNTGDILNLAASSIFESFIEGAKMGGINISLDSIIYTIEDLMGESYPEKLKTIAGRTAMKMMIPSVIITVIKMSPRGYIPHEEVIAKACYLAIKGITQDKIKPFLELMIPIISRFALVAAQGGVKAIGEKLDSIEQRAEDSDSSEEEYVPPKDNSDLDE